MFDMFRSITGLFLYVLVWVVFLSKALKLSFCPCHFDMFGR